MSTIYQNLNVIAITVGCSGWNSKRGFLNLHLSDGKIVRFNEWDTEELDRLKDVINGSVRVGIKKKRKYYYLETIVKESEGVRRGRETLEYIKSKNE
jgi:exopolysaccharide biosynthesis protein